MPRAAVTYVLHLDIEDGPASLPRRVSRAVVRAIAEGQLADGDRMPSTRTLARSLAIARSVAVEAYDELTAAGFLTARPGSGTHVVIGASAAARAGAFSSAVATASRPAVVRTRPDGVAFDLSPGFPDTALISEKAWTRAWRTAARAALSPPKVTWLGDVGESRSGGAHRRFRQQLSEHLRTSRGLLADPERIFLFSGVNAAIRTLVPLVARPGRTLAFEDPGYPGARAAFLAGGSAPRPVPVDDEGLVVTGLTPGDWGVYVTPGHQYPLGARLSVARRSALLAWADRHDGVVFEDDYDGEFRYQVAPMPAVAAMTAGAERVIYLGTASKVLARELRVAWAVVPERLVDDVRSVLREQGESVSSLPVLALTEFIESGALVRQVASSHRTYAARRERFASACRQLLPQVRLHGVDAGLHVVLTFGQEIDDVLLARQLLARGVECSPLSRFYALGGVGPAQGLVCGYARLAETRARTAVTIIRDVLSRHHPVGPGRRESRGPA